MSADREIESMGLCDFCSKWEYREIMVSAPEAFRGDRGFFVESMYIFSLKSCTVFWGLVSEVVGVSSAGRVGSASSILLARF